MRTAVYTSVLLDVLGADPEHGEASREALRAAYRAAAFAGSLWRRHRNRARGSHMRVVADFLVGAHARLHADALLTRDRCFYRGHFTGLRVSEPAR